MKNAELDMTMGSAGDFAFARHALPVLYQFFQRHIAAAAAGDAAK